MELEVELFNKSIDGILKVTLDGQTKELSEDNRKVIFNCREAEKHRLDVEYVCEGVYDKIKTSNPVARFFLKLLLAVFVAFQYLFDSYDNIRGAQIYSWIKHTQPFDCKKSYTIKNLGDTLTVKYINSSYSPKKKELSKPDFELTGCNSDLDFHKVTFNETYFKKEYKFYNTPVYTVLFAFTLFLNVLFTIIAVNVFSGIDWQNFSEYAFSVFGIGFCLLFVLFLLIMTIVALVRSYRLCKEICRKYKGNLQ